MDEPEGRPDTGDGWTPINDRRIGGHHERPGYHHRLPRQPRQPREPLWIDTGSGPGLEIPPDQEIPPGATFTFPPTPTGTLSGGWGPPLLGRLNKAGDKDPAEPTPVVPDTIPSSVEADTLVMLLTRHQPHDDTHCACGQQLETTGLCWYGRQAQRRLYDLTLDRKANGDDG
nr:hypothetical protein [Micromonospora sp. DSM 115978]